jgi:hypothetical protein
MNAVQDAINAGKDIDELVEMFDDEVLWDCVVVLSGNKDTTWSILFNLEGSEQTNIEDWQSEFNSTNFQRINGYRTKNGTYQKLDFQIPIQDNHPLYNSVYEAGFKNK